MLSRGSDAHKVGGRAEEMVRPENDLRKLLSNSLREVRFSSTTRPSITTTNDIRWPFRALIKSQAAPMASSVCIFLRAESEQQAETVLRRANTNVTDG
jgi:hypothetical protein